MEGLAGVFQNLGASGLFVRNKLGFFFAPSSGKDLLLLLQLWVEKVIAKVLPGDYNLYFAKTSYSFSTCG